MESQQTSSGSESGMYRLDLRKCKKEDCGKMFRVLHTSTQQYHSDTCNPDGPGIKFGESGARKTEQQECTEKIRRGEMLVMLREMRANGETVAECVRVVGEKGYKNADGRPWQYQAMYNLLKFEGVKYKPKGELVMPKKEVTFEEVDLMDEAMSAAPVKKRGPYKTKKKKKEKKETKEKWAMDKDACKGLVELAKEGDKLPQFATYILSTRKLSPRQKVDMLVDIYGVQNG